MKYKYLYIFCIGFSSLIHSQDLKIGLKNEEQSEKVFKKKLIRILEEYDVGKWIFVDTLLIAKDEIPHSHPVLTLNTKPQSDLSLLSTFIHENIHWFLAINNKPTNIAIKHLKSRFKNVPVGNGEGAKDEYSTYLHLLVNYLEYDAIKQIAGRRAADIIISRKTYYKWIYRTVLSNEEYLKEIIEKYNLNI